MINSSIEKELSLDTALSSNNNIVLYLQNETYSSNTESGKVNQEDLSNFNDISSNKSENENPVSEILSQLTFDEYTDPLYEDVVQQGYADFGYTAEQEYEDDIAELSRQDDEHIAPISPYSDEF